MCPNYRGGKKRRRCSLWSYLYCIALVKESAFGPWWFDRWNIPRSSVIRRLIARRLEIHRVQFSAVETRGFALKAGSESPAHGEAGMIVVWLVAASGAYVYTDRSTTLLSTAQVGSGIFARLTQSCRPVEIILTLSTTPLTTPHTAIDGQQIRSLHLDHHHTSPRPVTTPHIPGA